MVAGNVVDFGMEAGDEVFELVHLGREAALGKVAGDEDGFDVGGVDLFDHLLEMADVNIADEAAGDVGVGDEGEAVRAGRLNWSRGDVGGGAYTGCDQRQRQPEQWQAARSGGVDAIRI